MDVYDTPVARARSHVADAETRVMRQTALVAELAQRGRDTADAQRLLDTFANSLEAMREHLAVEERYRHD